ncbi:hypothetical protein WR25_08984 [Diploscapter pachys]|uniref:ShKT domain-containing protein n=1 Tax=Diploscapter pachys TaxID=2018661 RepID=A0A2A2M138_9BILA|nr:hypothetical protein WR25_08984 [Diploscapter pachys]
MVSELKSTPLHQTNSKVTQPPSSKHCKSTQMSSTKVKTAGTWRKKKKKIKPFSMVSRNRNKPTTSVTPVPPPPPNERPKRAKVETESEYCDATMDNTCQKFSGLPPCPLHPWMPQTIPTIPTAPAVPAVIPPYRPPVIAPYSFVPQISPYAGISQISTYTGVPQVATNLGSYYANLGSSVGAVRSTCMDTHEKCAIWASTGQCSLNAVAMRRLCPVSCGTCLSGSTIGTAGSVGSAIGTYPSVAYVAQPTPIVTSSAYNYPYPYTGSIYTGRSIYENNVLRSPTIKSSITPITKDLNSEVAKNNKKFFY